MPSERQLLFVCLGNIIRSPLAEHLFIHLQAEAGLDHQYRAESAGTAGWHAGEQPDARMRRTAAEHGVQYSGSARQVTPQDLEAFDLILAMDRSNQGDLQAMASPGQRHKIRLLREFDPLEPVEPDVPDPYYGGQEGFEQTYGIVERSVRGLLEALQRGEV